MQADFHYYATYCAAFLAGYNHNESLTIAYSANFVDCCTSTLLNKLQIPTTAATTQSQIELADSYTDILGLQEISRIWASFHFLPGNLNAKVKSWSKTYKNKYRLICFPNSNLVKKTVELAKGESLQAVGLSMHVLADTWAHEYFAGTPSLVINNTNSHFYEIDQNGKEEKISFTHNVRKKDNLETRTYINSIYQESENGIMNLGHGRAGHLPDYSFVKYKYLPAWSNYEEIVKDNPTEYYKAFCQMVYAMKYLRGEAQSFELDTYENLDTYKNDIQIILKKRQLTSENDWKEFALKLSGKKLEDFDIKKWQDEYQKAEETNKNNTNLSKFVVAALKQKTMVTNEVYLSKNILLGYSINNSNKSLKRLKDYLNLIEKEIKEGKNN